MSTNYPDGTDEDGLKVTTLPEETPLSQAGPGAIYNHPELHDSINDAVLALEIHAAQKTHDHSGDAANTKKGSKLAQANTHQAADTDTATGSIHHTLGTDANQAAAGNHTHSYNALTNRPIIQCTSGTRPGSPALGQLIYETDTYRMYSWAQYPGDDAASWHFLLGPLPNIRLRQGANQQLVSTGTVLEWHEEIEDSYGGFNAGTSLTDAHIKVAGLYQVTAAIQWDPNKVPDIAHVMVLINGVETTVRQSQYIRGNTHTPGFSQTLTATGPLRLALDDVITVKVRYTAGGGLLGLIFSFFDTPSKVNSRLDIVYQGP